MRYLPKSPADRKEMLAEIGVASIDDLFSTIPAEYRLTRDLERSATAWRAGGHRALQGVCREECDGLCELSGRGGLPTLPAGTDRYGGFAR